MLCEHTQYLNGFRQHDAFYVSCSKKGLIDLNPVAVKLKTGMEELISTIPSNLTSANSTVMVIVH